MKTSYAILLFFIVFSLNSINAKITEGYVEMILNINKISELEALVQNNQDTLHISGGLSVETRKLDFGITYHTYEFEFESKNVRGTFPICALILSKNDTIILNATRSLFKKKYQIRYDDLAMKQYLRAHQKLYRIQTNLNTFINELASDYILEFGCGEAGLYYSPEAKKMKQWVAISNKKALNDWLRSPNPELQTYGALGLTLVNRNGKRLTEDEQIIISHLKQKNNDIQICSGCLYGLTEKFVDIIESDE